MRDQFVCACAVHIQSLDRPWQVLPMHLNCEKLQEPWNMATHSLTWQEVEFVTVAPLKSQVMEGDSGLPYATQTSSTVDPLFTVSLGVVTTTATLGVSVCALKFKPCMQFTCTHQQYSNCWGEGVRG